MAFLHLKVQKSDKGLSINQHKYTKDLIPIARHSDACPVDTPLALNVKYRNVLTEHIFMLASQTLVHYKSFYN